MHLYSAWRKRISGHLRCYYHQSSRFAWYRFRRPAALPRRRVSFCRRRAKVGSGRPAGLRGRPRTLGIALTGARFPGCPPAGRDAPGALSAAGRDQRAGTPSGDDGGGEGDAPYRDPLAGSVRGSCRDPAPAMAGASTTPRASSGPAAGRRIVTCFGQTAAALLI